MSIFFFFFFFGITSIRNSISFRKLENNNITTNATFIFKFSSFFLFCVVSLLQHDIKIESREYSLFSFKRYQYYFVFISNHSGGIQMYTRQFCRYCHGHLWHVKSLRNTICRQANDTNLKIV